MLKQTELEEINLHANINNDDVDASSLLLLAMKSSHKLKKLKFSVDGFIDFTEAEFKEFLGLISCLELLDLSESFLNIQWEEFQFQSVEYAKLKTLKISKIRFEHDGQVVEMISEILNQCPSLQCLHLHYINDRILQTIFDHHVCKFHYLCYLRCINYRFCSSKYLS